jgi:hypothetical protein
MSDPFDDARLKLERAEERIAEFDRLTELFYADQPWNVQINLDPERGKYVHKLVLAKRLGRHARAVAAEALAAIRSSLDLATSAAARLNPVTSGRVKCYFPFLQYPDDWATFGVRQCIGVPQDVIDFFWSLRPYPGGDDRLYGLSKARNDDEHWAISPTVPTSVAYAINEPGKPQKIVQIPEWPKGGIDELELCTTDEFPDPNGKLQMVFTITFDHSPYFGRESVEAVLKGLHTQATGIVNDVERICRKLGIL